MRDRGFSLIEFIAVLILVGFTAQKAMEFKSQGDLIIDNSELGIESEKATQFIRLILADLKACHFSLVGFSAEYDVVDNIRDSDSKVIYKVGSPIGNSGLVINQMELTNERIEILSDKKEFDTTYLSVKFSIPKIDPDKSLTKKILISVKVSDQGIITTCLI